MMMQCAQLMTMTTTIIIQPVVDGGNGIKRWPRAS